MKDQRGMVAGSSLPDLDSVIIALHEGVLQKPYWTGFLAELRSLANADYASLTFRRADARYQDLNVMKSGSAATNPEFNDIHDLVRRLNLPYDSIELNRAHNLQDILGINDHGNAEYIQYLQHRSINYAFVIRVTEPGGGSCWLTIGRTGQDFSNDVRPLLDRLAPHLSIAARTLATLEHEVMRGNLAADAIRRLNFGWMTFDEKGCVIEIEEGTQQLFLTTPNLGGCRGGQLLPLPRSRQKQLLAILADFATQRFAKPSAFHIIDEPCLDMLVVPISYRAVSGGPTPVAVGYVYGVSAPGVDRCGQLEQLFGLTTNEARLAVALSQGKSIAEAAVQLNLAVETARNYTKRIYAKTDTRGQADLVRIILAGVIALS